MHVFGSDEFCRVCTHVFRTEDAKLDHTTTHFDRLSSAPPDAAWWTSGSCAVVVAISSIIMPRRQYILICDAFYIRVFKI